MKRSLAQSVLYACGLALGIGMAWTMDGLVADENYHARQIERFVRGRYELSPDITVIPAYHAAVAWIARAFGGYSDQTARMVTLAGGLALLPLARALARPGGPGAADLKALQVFFQPLFFPFFFLVYTEAWSMVALAAMMLAVMRGRAQWAALAGLAGVLIRQDFIVWVALAYAVLVLEGVEPSRRRLDWLTAAARNGWRRGLPLLVVMAAFAAYVAWNRGIALGGREMHDRVGNVANVYFFLWCAWLVFLPQNLYMLPRVLERLRNPTVLGLVLAGFPLYWLGYSNPHVFNQEHLRFYLHNEALYWITRHDALRGALYVPLVWTLLAMLSTPLSEARLRLLHPFMLLAAFLHPLVEQRYYLPAFMLFNVWRNPLPLPWERFTVLAYIPVCAVLLAGIAAERFFL